MTAEFPDFCRGKLNSPIRRETKQCLVSALSIMSYIEPSEGGKSKFIESGDKIKSDKSLFPLQKPKEGFIAQRGKI